MSRALVLVVAVALSGAMASCGDPVHDNDVTALGPEAPGVSPGPDHRPGQPCLTCHGGQGPASTDFALAGTVYQEPTTTTGANGVIVQLTDVHQTIATATTNTVGNFYVLASSYSPTYPVDVELNPNPAADAIKMLTHIGRNGSCGYCHFDPGGPASPGHVYLTGGQ